MRNLLIAALMFVALSVGAHAAQEKKVTVRWHRTAPESEAFAVLMPEPPLRVRRVIPFSEELKLATPVYEVAYRGILYSVLSVDKKAAAAFKTQTDLFNGLRRAIQYGSRPADSEFAFEREVTLKDQTARQFQVRAKGKEGTARVYETATHFYVLMTLGARSDELMASNFFNSFTLDTKGARDASDRVTVIQDFSQSARAPEPLWPLVVSVPAIGPIGPVGGNAPAAPTANATPQSHDPSAISGGVLNGKATKKPQPVYPPIAAAARAQGTVVVQVTVDEEGYVISARATSGHPLLQQAAVLAARQARFEPTLLEGKPVKVRGVITYNFVLAPDPSEPPTRRY
jgi:TonB family protein